MDGRVNRRQLQRQLRQRPDHEHEPVGQHQRQFAGNGVTSEASAANQLLFDGTYYYTDDANGNRTARYENSHEPSLDWYATNITTYTLEQRERACRHLVPGDRGHNALDLGQFRLRRLWPMVAEAENGVGSNFVYDGHNLLLVLDVRSGKSWSGNSTGRRWTRCWLRRRRRRSPVA